MPYRSSHNNTYIRESLHPFSSSPNASLLSYPLPHVLIRVLLSSYRGPSGVGVESSSCGCVPITGVPGPDKAGVPSAGVPGTLATEIVTS
jgi:hypothetical protein